MKLLCCFVVVFLALGCSSSRDARTATTADLLFQPKKFQQANDEKRAALDRLRGDHSQLADQNTQLSGNVNAATARLQERRAKLAAMDVEISSLDQRIASLSSQEKESRDFAQQKSQELDAVKAKWKKLAVDTANDQTQEDVNQLELSLATLKRAISAWDAARASGTPSQP